jgi:solute carrier family 31 (copper transporter), member 1
MKGPMSGCRVMQNGFQFATGPDACITFLFKGWGVDTHTKYAFMLICVFAMGILNGGLAYVRHRLVEYSRQSSTVMINQLYLSLVYGIQIILAYWIMLLVMTYETGLFIALIIGLVLGYFVFGCIEARNLQRTALISLPDGSTFQSQFNSTPCCQTTA